MSHPVDRYVNRLLRRRRPKPFAPTQDELAVMRTAIDLMAAAPDAQRPRPAFVERLHDQLAEQERTEQGGQVAQPAWRTPARRRFLAAGALTATGAAVGVGADRMLVVASGGDRNGRPGQPGPGTGPDPGPQPAELTPTAGVWRDVAASADLREGAVQPFDLGAVNGFLRRASGRVQAVSGVCTHQGCRLELAGARDKLSCPCHGATFTVAGVNVTHPRQSSGPLPALPRLPVRERDGRIEVYAPPANPSDQG
jgi:nitrite reductase/ring-hydroxylating ferredoxin subunit